MKIEDMRAVEWFVKSNLDNFDAVQMVEGLRDTFLSVALIGYGAIYYVNQLSIKERAGG